MDEQYTGSRISQARKDKGWTQKDLADRLHVSAAAVSKWERGLNFPDISLLQPLARELDVSAAELLGLENETAETAVQAITQISKSEETQKNKKVKIVLLLAISALIAVCIIICAQTIGDYEKIQSVMNDLYSGRIGISWLFPYFGLFSWIFGIAALISEKRVLNVLSAAFCPLAMFTSTFVVADKSFDERYDSIIVNFILLAGTFLLNFCSAAIYCSKRRKIRKNNPHSVDMFPSVQPSKSNHKNEIIFRKILNVLFLVHIFFGPILFEDILYRILPFEVYLALSMDIPLFGFIASLVAFSIPENIAVFLPLLLLYFVFICTMHILLHRIFYKTEQSKKIKIIVIIILIIDIMQSLYVSLVIDPSFSLPCVTIVFDLLYIALSFNMIPFWAKQEDIEKWEQARTEKAKQKAALSSSVEATAPQEEP